MPDTISLLAQKLGEDQVRQEKVGEFAVQGVRQERQAVFDPHNGRVKLFGLVPEDLEAPEVRQLVNGLNQVPDLYSKLTVYALPGEEEAWIRHMFLNEGFIAGFFADGVTADLWALYADGARMDAPQDGKHNEIVALAVEKDTRRPELPAGYGCRVADPSDAAELANLLQGTFSEYPVSLSAEHLRRAMEDGDNHFRCVEDEAGQLVAAASAELDLERKTAEMTDCATDPQHRGQGLMAYILWRLGLDVAHRHGIEDVYTLARADEVGMNCVFSRLGYNYTGRLVNNCRMPNGWESMNIWCRLDRGPAASLD